MKFEGWRKAAKKASRWFTRVEEGTQAFKRKLHHAETCRAAERHAKSMAEPPTVGIYTRRGEEAGGGRRGGEGSCARD